MQSMGLAQQSGAQPTPAQPPQAALARASLIYSPPQQGALGWPWQPPTLQCSLIHLLLCFPQELSDHWGNVCITPQICWVQPRAEQRPTCPGTLTLKGQKLSLVSLRDTEAVPVISLAQWPSQWPLAEVPQALSGTGGSSLSCQSHHLIQINGPRSTSPQSNCWITSCLAFTPKF